MRIAVADTGYINSENCFTNVDLKMGYLADKKWNVYTIGKGADSVSFYADGTAIITFPDGNIANARWYEESNGHFMFKLHYSLLDRKINQVYFGTCNGNIANGFWTEKQNTLNDFSMKHDS
jgi:hypothetical protein